MVVLALLAAASYNAFSSVFGGLRYLVRPHETHRVVASAAAAHSTTNGAPARDGDSSATKTAS
jgi:hypothetical protein